MIRAFESADLREVVAIWHTSGLEEYDYLPAFQALDSETALAVFKRVILPACDIWVEGQDKQLRGFMALNGSYIDRLYVRPACQRQGVGNALLSFAKTLHPQGLTLHTHQQNTRARRFYETRGFAPLEYGVSPPPESMPDVKYGWRP